jgi:hypothetical protein
MWLKNLLMLTDSTSSRRRLIGRPPDAPISLEALEDRLVPSYSNRDLDARPAPARPRRMRQTVSRRRMVRPPLGGLEGRLARALFTPTTFSDGIGSPGTVNTLRDAIIAANNDNGTDTDTIRLSAGEYKLTSLNIYEHEVSSLQGDPNITNANHALIIEGATDAQGKPATIITQPVADRAARRRQRPQRARRSNVRVCS